MIDFYITKWFFFQMWNGNRDATWGEEMSISGCLPKCTSSAKFKIPASSISGREV